MILRGMNCRRGARFGSVDLRFIHHGNRMRAGGRGRLADVMPYATPLTDAELPSALASLPDWARDGAILRRTVKVADFRAAVALVNRVADAAEAANHHPDISITGYRNVTFELS